jgi:hypothetical protein
MAAFYPSSGYFPDFVVIQAGHLGTGSNGNYEPGLPHLVRETVFFSGFAATNKELVKTAERFNKYICKEQNPSLRSYPGSYNAVVRNGGVTFVSNDLFGLCPIFYYQGSSYIFVSNRIHLIAKLMATYRIPRRANRDIATATLCSSHRFFAHPYSHDTVLADVRICPANSFLAVTRQATVQILQKPEHCQGGRYKHQDYRELIACAAKEIKANVAAVLDSDAFSYRILDISGGKDSRAVFGAAAALGQLGRCVARVSKGPSAGDLETGTAIAARFGVPLDSVSPHRRYSKNARFVLGSWRSMIAGMRHELGATMWPALWQKHGVVRLNGGCGEVYRDFWAKGSLLPQIMNRERFDRVCRPGLAPRFREAAFNSIWRSIRSLPGEDVNVKVRNHYLFFRNRFHFGLPAYNDWNGYVQFSPLQSPALLAASGLLDRNSCVQGKAIFDVLEQIEPALNRIPFGDGSAWPREWRKHGDERIQSLVFDDRLRKAHEKSEEGRKLWSLRNGQRVDALQEGESAERELCGCGSRAINDLRAGDSTLAAALDDSFAQWYSELWRHSAKDGSILASKVLSIYDLCFDPELKCLDVSGLPFAERYSAGIDRAVQTIVA